MTSLPADLTLLSATQAGAAFRAGQLSPVQLTEAYLARIERVDGRLGSYITVAGDHARQAARQAEAEIIGGLAANDGSVARIASAGL